MTYRPRPADRLSVRLFDAANDLWCDNWANEAWMSVVQR